MATGARAGRAGVLGVRAIGETTESVIMRGEWNKRGIQVGPGPRPAAMVQSRAAESAPPRNSRKRGHNSRKIRRHTEVGRVQQPQEQGRKQEQQEQ